MPYRRYAPRRRYKRYPRKSSGGTDYIRMAKAAYTGVRYLKSLVNVEKHPLDVSITQLPDNTTGTFDCLNLTAQGDDDFNRDGNSILMKSVNLNFSIAVNSLATATVLRYILFIDKQSNGSTPIITDLLTSTGINGNYNHDNAVRFNILADKKIILSNSGGYEAKISRCYRKMQLHAHYDGTTATIGNIVDNAIWLFMVSSEPTNTPTVSVRSQLMFIDN